MRWRFKNTGGEKIHMNIGFWCCIALVPAYLITAILFAVFKGKCAKYITGFNSLPKKEQPLYDQEAMAKDMRNSYLLYALIMLLGAVFSVISQSIFSGGSLSYLGIFLFREVQQSSAASAQSVRKVSDKIGKKIML